MTRRTAGRSVVRSRVWRTAAICAAFVVTGGPVAFAQDAAGDPLVASGEPPVVATAEPVETGTVDGATVAVGLPPVPPPVVAVDTPPVPVVPAAGQTGRPPLPNLPDTGDDAAHDEVAASIAGTVAGLAGDAWRD